nr:hypothetical protein [Kibdelosporangium sp. MJ126-NF4]
MRKLITAGVALLALTSAVPAQAAPATPDLPRPTGPRPIGVTELHLVQHGRPDPFVPGETRELMVSVWYPALPLGRRAPYVAPALADYYTATGPPAGLATDWKAIRTHSRTNAPALPGKFPVVLYSPGVGNPRALGTILVEELASRGYVVVTIDHTYETAVAFPDGTVKPAKAFDVPVEEREKAKQRMMDAREDDARFVIDNLGRFPTADESRTGMFGHSGGGITAGRVMQADRRVNAGINLDGWYQFGYNRPEKGVDRPFMMMGGGSNPAQPPLFGKPRNHLTEPDWGAFWNASTGPMLDLNIPTGMHYTFTDGQWLFPRTPGDHSRFIGTVDPKAAIDAQRAYVPAFFDQYLKGRHQPLLAGPSPRHPDVKFVR